MRSLAHTVLLCGLFMISFFLLGCGGSGEELTELSGTATFDGKPIKYGQIEFIADSEKGHAGPAASSEIIDGKFDTSLNETGVKPGSHTVRVTAYRKQPPVSEDETKVVETEPPLFVGYPLEADIKKSEQKFDVPADAEGFNMYQSRQSRRGPNTP